MTSQPPDRSNRDDTDIDAKIEALQKEFERRLACLNEPGARERMRSITDNPPDLSGVVITSSSTSPKQGHPSFREVIAMNPDPMANAPRQSPVPVNDDPRFEEVFARCRAMTESELKSEGLANVVQRVTASGEPVVLSMNKQREAVILDAQAWAEQQLELQRLRDRFQNRLNDPAVLAAIDRDLMGGMTLNGTVRVGDSD